MAGTSYKSFVKRVKQYARTQPDFWAVIERTNDLVLPWALAEVIRSHERGPELAYYLGRHRRALKLMIKAGNRFRERIDRFSSRYLPPGN